MSTKKPHTEYSEPVREIMNNPPPRIVRWGNLILVSVFSLFIILAWLIRYPDVILAPVEITTENPPVTLVSKIPGHIKELYVEDGEEVSKGQLIAAMETVASVREVRELKKAVSLCRRPENLLTEELPELIQLGEIQEFWSAYLKSLSDFNTYVVNDYYGNKINSVNEEIHEILEYTNRLKVKEKFASENRALESGKYRRDSLLFISGVFSETDLEKSRQSYLKSCIEFQQVRIDLSQKSIELSEKKQLLQDYEIKRSEEQERYYSNLNREFLNLRARLEIWENTYLLIAPVDGQVAFTKYWSRHQSVLQNEPVMSIIPDFEGVLIGRLKLNMSRSGKVRTGQTANIKLSGYPYLEFGMVRGIVKSKSLVPENDRYIIELSLPSGLVTLYGKKLEFTQNMQGTAEILTDDIRLLEKLVYPVHHLITKNKRPL